MSVTVDAALQIIDCDPERYPVWLLLRVKNLPKHKKKKEHGAGGRFIYFLLISSRYIFTNGNTVINIPFRL